MATVLVALGSNLGDRIARIDRAVDLVGAHPAITVVGRSNWYCTRPIGGPAGQGEFVNAAIRLETSLAPEALLAALQNVEADLGRQRRARWEARTIDLDLLLFGELILKTPRLEVPHPRMAFRRFVLEPAVDVAPAMRHPSMGWTVRQMLDHLDHAANYMALTGVPGTGKTPLARRVAESTSSRLIRDVAPGLRDVFDATDRRSATAKREIELLERRCACLAAADGEAEASGVVSDFWVGQGLAYGRFSAGKQDYKEIEAAWRRFQRRVISPKLLVVLTAPSDWLLAHSPGSGGDLDRLQKELLEVVLQARRGPILELDASRPEGAFAELTAAFEAMQ